MDAHETSNDPTASYNFYQGEEDPYSGIMYQPTHQISPYVVQNVQSAPPPRSISTPDLQAMQLRTLNLDSLPQQQQQQHPHYSHSLLQQHHHHHPQPHPAHRFQQYHPAVISPHDDGSVGSLSSAHPSIPPSPPPVSPPHSSSDVSEHGQAGAITFNPHQTGTITPNTTPSSGATSPTSSRGSSLVHRTHSHPRYNPTPSPSQRRRRGRSADYSDGEDDGIGNHIGVGPGGGMIMGVGGMGGATDPHMMDRMANSRKEVTRKQRIEAEQRRRDELREGYARLKDVLPITNQKSSKVSLLERATNHIVNLTKMNETLQQRLTAQDLEITRLRHLNERISGIVPGSSTALSSTPPSIIPPSGQSSSTGQPLSASDHVQSPSLLHLSPNPGNAHQSAANGVDENDDEHAGTGGMYAGKLEPSTPSSVDLSLGSTGEKTY